MLRLIAAVFVGLLFFSAPASAEKALESKHDVKIDPSKPHPGILFSDILKSMSDQQVWRKGQLRMFERVRMTFLPDFDNPTGNSPYHPTSGARLAHQVENAKGKVVSTVLWNCREDKFPFWTCSATGNGNPDPLSAGKYTLTWFIEGKPFWDTEIKVSKEGGADAYSKPKYYVDGPWDDYAYIYVPKGNLDATPIFSLFLRDKKSRPGKWTEGRIEVTIRRNGRVVAAHPAAGRRGKSVHNLRPWWERLDLSLHNPKDRRSSFKAAELVKRGRYKVTVKLNGKRYATYTYRANGKMPFTGRQNRKKAKPLDYLEGGRDRFYIKRK